MLPTQILLNNFLYDFSQMTIPADHVDPALIASRIAGTSASSAVHARLRADQLDLRFPDFRRPLWVFHASRTRRFPYRLVRGVAGDADACHFRHPDRGQSAEEPAQPIR